MSDRRTTVALAAWVSAWMVGCAHGPTPPPPAVPPTRPPTEEAREAFEDASSVFARHEAAGQWDGEACHETLAAFERAQDALGGRDGRAVYMSGMVAQRCGNDEGARQLWSRALELDPSLCQPRVALGIDALEQGHAERARAHFEEAVRRDNRCVTGYVNLAAIQSRHPGEREAAVANLRRALAVRADYLPAFDRLALTYLAQAESQPELLDLAAMVCRQAQLVDPTYAPIYNTWALIDLRRGDVTGAAAKLARAVELDPTFFEALMNFGQLTLSQRAYRDAVGAFRRARELRPRSYDAALGLGVALRGLERPEEAERLYRAATELDEDRPEAWFDLAVLYQEHREGSVEQLRQAEAFLQEFVRRARGEDRFAETVREVMRWCDGEGSRRRRDACRPGRAQRIHQSLAIQGERPDQRPDWLR
ncbi:MAG TPA: tetratricopeptide repeat protein [Sandaracinaceae bacterium LLY-WYZ-13_1]|nr:tetratricopeptide repeat protein [Sandaracinaceae bacterium LLY-WYZ-13_1]